MEKHKLSIYFFSGTHWDREWYQDFQGFRYRLVEMTNKVIDVLEKDPEFKVFHFDGQTIALEDFTEIEPEKSGRLIKLITDGRLLVGPWYVMPDEFLLSGESLIRNLMIGHGIVEKMGAKAWKYGYICDIFGHIAQMPQIFNGFGIKYSLLGRGTNEHNCPSHFIWKAPDGSECITYKLPDNDGYGAFCCEVIGWNRKGKPKSDEELKGAIRGFVERETARSPIPIVLIMDGMDHENIHERTPEYIEWISELYPNAEVYHTSLEDMGKELEAYRSSLSVKAGEINETAKEKGGYVHLISHTLSSRYPIKQANDICQVLLEKWVEPFAAIAALNGLDLQKAYVDSAYKYLIQNHPHDSICGCSIDQVHKDMEYRFDQVKSISGHLIEAFIDFERKGYEMDESSHFRVLSIWNPLPFKRHEVVMVDIGFNRDYSCTYQEPFGYELINSFKIYDSEGTEIPYGLVSIKRNYSIRRFNRYAVDKSDIHTISFEAELPAMGKAEYKIVPSEKPSRYLECISEDELKAENENIELEINNDGTLRIKDKKTGVIYDKLLSFIDDGEIGDGWYHVNPVQDRLVCSQGQRCIIERVENGPSRCVFSITHFMEVPEAMDYHTHGIRRSEKTGILKIKSLVGLSKGSTWVDIETDIENNIKDHRLRLKLPTGIQTPMYFASQPFAFVERKTGINAATSDWKERDVLEKQMNGIVGKRSEDGNGIAFISAYGLHECGVAGDSEGSIYITLFRSFQKTVMTNGEPGGQIQGDLHFKYCIMPIQREVSYADMVRVQECLQVGCEALTVRIKGDYHINTPRSFFEVEGKNICASILKRAERNEKGKVVIRLYNLSGEISKASVSCFKDLARVNEVNLNEEYVRSMDYGKNSFEAELGAWEIKTFMMELK